MSFFGAVNTIKYAAIFFENVQKHIMFHLHDSIIHNYGRHEEDKKDKEQKM